MKKSIFIIFILSLFACHYKEPVSFHSGDLSYPTEINPQDSSFYIYQYKDSLSTLDSLDAAEYGKYFLAGFNEPNLSTRPQQKTVFRFTYDKWSSHPIIINLTEDRLIVKEGIRGGPYPDYDIKRLSKTEQEQLQLSEWYFRAGFKKRTDVRRRPFFDSVFRAWPKLDDITSYTLLREKCRVDNREKFEYAVKTMRITKDRYSQLVKLINESGFWGMQRESWCKDVPDDATFFTLEANTPTQFKIVGSPVCSEDYRKFTRACQEIVNSTGLNRKIQLIRDGSFSSADTFQIHEVPPGQPQK